MTMALAVRTNSPGFLCSWRTAAALVASVLAAGMPCNAQAPTPAPVTGLRYDIQFTSTNSTSGNGTPSATSTTGLAHVAIANGNVRVDVVSGEFAALLGAGDFMIYKDTGHSVLVFKPSMAKYMSIDLQKMSAGLTKTVNSFGGALGVKATNVKLSMASLGPGDNVGTLTTSKYRLTQDYTLSVGFMGIESQSTKMHSTTDYWFTPNLSMIVNPFSQIIQETAWLGPDYGKQLADLHGKLPKGMPVKEVTTDVATDTAGTRTTSTVTWALTNFVRANVPDAAFQIPAGYTQMQGGPGQLLQTLSGLMNGGAAGNGGMAKPTLPWGTAPTGASGTAGAPGAAPGGATAAGGTSTSGTTSTWNGSSPASSGSGSGGTWNGSTAPSAPAAGGQNPVGGVAGQAGQSAIDSAAARLGKLLPH